MILVGYSNIFQGHQEIKNPSAHGFTAQKKQDEQTRRTNKTNKQDERNNETSE